jgi:hypothetical protein
MLQYALMIRYYSISGLTYRFAVLPQMLFFICALPRINFHKPCLVNIHLFGLSIKGYDHRGRAV